MAELMKEKNWNCSAPWLQGDTLQLGNVNQHEPTDPMKVGVDQYVFDSCVAVCV
jgi:esterase/lipase